MYFDLNDLLYIESLAKERSVDSVEYSYGGTFCIRFLGATSNGYPVIRYKKVKHTLNRVLSAIHLSLDYNNREDKACHKCDRRWCINVLHLFTGSQKDNMKDASNKRRMQGQHKTHCLRGHLLSDDNCYKRANSNVRACRTCAILKSKERYAANKRN